MIKAMSAQALISAPEAIYSPESAFATLPKKIAQREGQGA
jgi:hypothetical protein